eukprot:g8994.t1
MSFSLAPHPIGIKYWSNIWKTCKDEKFEVVHGKFQNWYQNKFYKSFGRYCMERPGGKWPTAIEAGKAYGQGGYKANPVPK